MYNFLKSSFKIKLSHVLAYDFYQGLISKWKEVIKKKESKTIQWNESIQYDAVKLLCLQDWGQQTHSLVSQLWTNETKPFNYPPLPHWQIDTHDHQQWGFQKLRDTNLL